MKILIIGGTGNISTPITRMMQEKGHDITLFNFDQKRPEWLLSLVKVINGNRKDLPKYETQIFEEGSYDCVIDMICFEPEDAMKDIALFNGRTNQFIFCSTVDVYPKSGSAFPVDETFEMGASLSFPYAWKKVECEKLFWKAHRNGDFQLTVIRPAATFNESWSPGVHSFGGQTYHLDRLLKRKPFILHGDGTVVWTAAYCDVTAGAFVGAIGNEKAYGQAYNANGDEMFTIKQMWLTIARVMNAPEPDFVCIPTHLLSLMAPAESEWCVENFMHNNIFDNSKAKRDLGFMPAVSYVEGVKLCFDYLTTHNLIENSDIYPFYDRIVLEWRAIEAEMNKIILSK